MKRRPIPILIIGWMFIIAGGVGFLYHLSDLQQPGWGSETLAVLLLRLAAMTGGILLLKGISWARWILLLWIASHIVLSLSEVPAAVLVHCLILGGMLPAFMHRTSLEYFQSHKPSHAGQ